MSNVNVCQKKVVQNTLKIQVADQKSNVVIFNIRKGTKMSKLMDAYIKKVEADPKSFRFMFDGKRVIDDDTAETLDLEDDDIIEAYEEQTGGSML